MVGCAKKSLLCGQGTLRVYDASVRPPHRDTVELSGCMGRTTLGLGNIVNEDKNDSWGVVQLIYLNNITRP